LASTDDTDIRWTYRRVVFDALLVSALVYVLVVPLGRFWVTGDPFVENGPHEAFQIIALLATASISVVHIHSSRARNFAGVALAIGSVAIMCCVREIQSCESEIPGGVMLCLPRLEKYLLTSGAALAFTVNAVLLVLRRPVLTRQLIHPRFSWPAVPFLLLFWFGREAEMTHLVVLEESAELTAYVLLLLCSINLASADLRRE
jgi:hypothetical protein